MATNSAKAKIELDSGPFEKGAAAVMNAANAMSRVVTTAMTAAGAALVAAFGVKTVRAITDAVKGVLDLGEEMANAGKKAGAAAGQFYLFTNAVSKGITLKTASRLIGDNAEALNRSAALFRDVSIKLWAVGEKIRGFWIGLMERVSPLLSKMLDGTLGVNLVKAGNDFGEALVNAVGVIYQLAKDGKLWDTIKEGFGIAFDYAIERLQWFARTAYDAIYQAVFNALFNALTTSFEDISAKFRSLATTINFEFSKALVDAAVSFMGVLNKWVVSFSKILVGFASGGFSGGGVAISQIIKGAVAPKVAPGLVDSTAKAAKAKEDREGFLGTIKKVFSESEFSPSGDLQARTDKLGEGLKVAFNKFKSELGNEPGASIENNSRRGAFGADSLTAVGGGGGVYLGLSVLDVNKAQLRELKEINARLGGGSPSTPERPNARHPYEVSLVRFQNNPPLQSSGLRTSSL